MKPLFLKSHELISLENYYLNINERIYTQHNKYVCLGNKKYKLDQKNVFLYNTTFVFT